MRGLFEALTEAPIGDISLHGDFDAPGSMDYEGNDPTGAPRKLVQKPAYHHALRRFFKNCPYVVHVHFVNLRGLYGTMKLNSEEVKKTFGLDLQPDPEAINAIYSSNQGDDAVPLTPWIVAHRLGHAMAQENKGAFDSYWDNLIDNFEVISQLLVNPLGDSKRYAPPQAAVMMLGTTKMCRDGNVSRAGEWFHDSVAQYILTGKVTLLPARQARNNIPFTIAQGWGYPSGEYTIKADADFDAVDAITTDIVKKTETWIKRLLRKNVGPHFLVI